MLSKKNRTLDRHRFFSSLQQLGKTLFRFGHALKGWVAMRDFREIATTLGPDMFILHMSNNKEQKKLCTEPKESDYALKFAITFERSETAKCLWHARD